MGTRSKGKIKQGVSSYKDKDGKKHEKIIDHRIHGSGKAKNIPEGYDGSKMKVIPRSKRV